MTKRKFLKNKKPCQVSECHVRSVEVQVFPNEFIEGLRDFSFLLRKTSFLLEVSFRRDLTILPFKFFPETFHPRQIAILENFIWTYFFRKILVSPQNLSYST